MTSRVLRNFRASLGVNREELLEEGARISIQLEEYELNLPYTYVKFGGERRKVELQPDGSLNISGSGRYSHGRWEYKEMDSSQVKTPEIRKLVENGRRRLKQVESQIDKVISLYPTYIAELALSGVSSKGDIMNKLISRKKQDLEKLFSVIKGDVFKRVYLQMDTHGFLFTFDSSRHYSYLTLPNLTFQQKLKFLTEFQGIKRETEQKLDEFLRRNK